MGGVVSVSNDIKPPQNLGTVGIEFEALKTKLLEEYYIESDSEKNLEQLTLLQSEMGNAAHNVQIVEDCEIMIIGINSKIFNFVINKNH